VASARGGIARLAFFFPGYAARHYRDLFARVLAVAPPAARLAFLVHACARPVLEALLAELGLGARSDVVGAPDDLAFSLWAQDAWLASEARGGVRLLVPEAFDRYQDAAAARLLADGLGLPVEPLALSVDGGNVLAGETVLLVGADSIALSQAHRGEPDPDAATAAIAALGGARRLVPVAVPAPVPVERRRALVLRGEAWQELVHFRNRAGSRQPVFHIDTFVSLAGRGAHGRERVLVGDPRAAAALIRHPLPAHALAECFDEVAAGLADAGLEVHRNPLPLMWMDEPAKRLRTWFFAPVNNVWVEDLGPGRRQVWLPCFGERSWSELATVDAANARAWEGLGFQVHRIPGFLPLAENLGGLSCLGKVLARAH